MKVLATISEAQHKLENIVKKSKSKTMADFDYCRYKNIPF